ncbi:LysR family transcriptional regulator [Propionivibrio limicola]|uniref:LysR family transcriptional regulator n=1 Tax=Propionivibrio limicola TaxID=167645 RepID=UPI00129098B3|nr:LysR family transcriptional regulator [Propionivibrio limicola]
MSERQQQSPLLDIHLLQLFELLYTTQSVSRAAEQLGMAQPTVSIWLGKLRRKFNDPLFVRTASGMQPTRGAEEMIVTVRATLDSLRHLSNWESRFDPTTSERRFRICMTDASRATLLPRLLAHIRSEAPRIRLGTERIDGHTTRLLESGEADLALGLVPDVGPTLYQQSLFTQDWVCLANRQHPRIDNELSLAAYQQEEHISIIAGTGYRLLDGALERLNIRRRVQLELPGFLGVGSIVSTTDLIVTLPRQIGETMARAAGLKVLACPFPIPTFTVKQHWHPRFHHDAGNRWLRGVCSALFLNS